MYTHVYVNMIAGAEPLPAPQALALLQDAKARRHAALASRCSILHDVQAFAEDDASPTPHNVSL